MFFEMFKRRFMIFLRWVMRWILVRFNFMLVIIEISNILCFKYIDTLTDVMKNDNRPWHVDCGYKIICFEFLVYQTILIRVMNKSTIFINICRNQQKHQPTTFNSHWQIINRNINIFSKMDIRHLTRFLVCKL